eukprot:scaffold4210_cov122-Isochrysis_galbana.AAC.2
MSTVAVILQALASQAAHVAEVLPGAATASSFVPYFDYTGPLAVSPAAPAPAALAAKLPLHLCSWLSDMPARCLRRGR